MALKRELQGLTPEDLDGAIYSLRVAADEVESSTMPPVASPDTWIKILEILISIIVYVRSEFYKNKAIKLPSYFNIPKWIGIIVFFVRKVKELVKAIKR
jgi:hypothetical protein